MSFVLFYKRIVSCEFRVRIKLDDFREIIISGLDYLIFF